MTFQLPFRFVATALLVTMGGIVGVGLAQGCGDMTVDEKRIAACELLCDCAGAADCSTQCNSGSGSFSISVFSASVSDPFSRQAEACYDCILESACEDFIKEGHCEAQCDD